VKVKGKHTFTQLCILITRDILTRKVVYIEENGQIPLPKQSSQSSTDLFCPARKDGCLLLEILANPTSCGCARKCNIATAGACCTISFAPFACPGFLAPLAEK
jgi:hypothetical protein